MTTELLKQALDALSAMQAEARARNCGLLICDIAVDEIRAHLAQPPATSAEYAMGYAEGFNDACKPKPQAEPVDKLTATAPREIWLQVSDEPRDAEDGFPADVEGITWCATSVLSEEVRYVREDLAHPAAPTPTVQSTARTIADEQSYDTGLWFVATTVTEAHLQAALRRLTYAVEAPVPAVPTGWTLVPTEPTKTMIAAGIAAASDQYAAAISAALSDGPEPQYETSAEASYRAMIAAHGIGTKGAT